MDGRADLAQGLEGKAGRVPPVAVGGKSVKKKKDGMRMGSPRSISYTGVKNWAIIKNVNFTTGKLFSFPFAYDNCLELLMYVLSVCF